MNKKKRALGKGLSALIPDEPIISNEHNDDGSEKIKEIEISLIEPNKEQPRREFNTERLLELTNSIKVHGVIQPIIVMEKDNGYELVAGERRWRAAKKAGLTKIPCIVRKLERLASTEIALIENLQREDLNVIEEALAYRSLINKYELTQEKISEAVGKSRSHITNIIRLLNLDKRIIELISEGKISNGHGRALLAITNPDLQCKLAQTIIEKQLSVRETEKLVKELGKEKAKKTIRESSKDPILSNIEESLRKTLGTKVKITKGRKKSKIEIEYYTDEDLERILDVISAS